MLAELRELAADLWWTTQAGISESFWAKLDPVIWDAVNHNPLRLLAEASLEHADSSWMQAAQEYIAARHRFLASPSKIKIPKTAYFCMEYGLHESLPIYSGGLGMLAGDHLRSASDQGMDLVAIGMFWHQGYFRQLIVAGSQVAAYSKNDSARLALELVRDESGAPLLISMPFGEAQVYLQAWRVRIGKVQLYLLDSDRPENPESVRRLCDRLYGGDSNTRIQQEWLLGIGGTRLLKAMNQDIAVYHLNEGHAAFLTFELWHREMAAGLDADAAWSALKKTCVFTTHTPVSAGHDRFTWEQFNSVAKGFRADMGLTEGAMISRGRVDPSNLDEKLCMTVLGMKGSRSVNGVSELHGEVSREMWKLLPVNIEHITNGVHAGAWLAPETKALFDSYLPNWTEHFEDASFWNAVNEIPFSAWIETRNQRRTRLVRTVRQLLGREILDENRLTLGFARRFATYKRGNLLFRDPDRLERLLDQGVQVVFAGKAHPADIEGQAIIDEILKWSRQKRFQNSIAFIPDYDMTIGRLLTSCTDVWLNTPRRPREASGTSGQKAALNGNPNCSILDGWWPEAYNGKNGWAIGDESDLTDLAAQDERDAELLYSLIEQDILPRFSKDQAWGQTMANSVQTCMPVFNTSRMLADYARQLYA